jgi:EAL domain-containing protein (putative c-di-GMP-specific phosphodiesterase class I)/CheY-like chemotaxis protein
MPDGGRIVVSLEHLAEGPDARGQICLKVSDTGTGMDAHTQAHLFEPFFTTKERGKGTGLGLATTFGIVTDAGGTISVDSAPGKGTTFAITLPHADEEAPSIRHAAGRVERSGHGEVVLVAEDDAVLRRVALRVLSSAGYSVHVAADGEEARRHIDALGDRLDVLVTDVNMPGCSGYELAERVQRTSPRAAVVLTSGFIEESERRHQPDHLPLLWKPTPPRDLVRAVGHALDSSGRRATVPPAERRVLLVEDEPAVAAGLVRVLERAGCRAEVASTLLQAEVALTARPPPHLILCDLGLGRDSAAPLLTRLRSQDPTLTSRLFILSGGAVDDDAARLLQDGHFRVLEKPLRPGRLQEVLAGAGLITSLPADAAPPAPIAPAAPTADGPTAPSADPHVGRSRPRVLIVDDDATLIDVALRTIGADFEVVAARTLGEARAGLAEGSWDALLLDVGLPDGNGLELLRERRGHHAELPVVLMTGNLTADAAATAFRGRITDYLQKPFTPHQLTQTLTSVVESGRLARLRTKLLSARYGGDEFLGDLAATEAMFLRALPKIRMVFQPIVRAVDSSVFAFEALLRCDEPTLASPMRLFTAAEVLGRVEDVGRVVRSRVAQTLQASPQRLESIFLNVHPLEVRADLLAEVADPLLAVAHRVVLEITERASLEGGASLDRELEQIRHLGYRLAVDDLGEGYAGLSSLVHLRPDIAKIDMSLVRDIHRMPLKRDIVAAIVDIARRSGITVVAEGIETVEERDTLVDLGCDLLQGYLFARPGPPFPTPRTTFDPAT